MAKARSRKKTARTRVKKDWVYRGFEWTLDEGVDTIVVPSGHTYGNLPRSLTQGSNNANTCVLYDSQNYLRQPVEGQAFQSRIAQSARAEGKRASVHAVEGIVRFIPSTWAIGDRLIVGMRLIVAEQDQVTGGASVPAEYSMWVEGPAPDAETSVYANGWEMLWERRIIQTFDDNDQAWTYNVRWSGTRRLRPECGLFLWLEAPVGLSTIQPRYDTWLRTLVADEG